MSLRRPSAPSPGNRTVTRAGVSAATRNFSNQIVVYVSRCHNEAKLSGQRVEQREVYRQLVRTTAFLEMQVRTVSVVTA
jgi:hypothetical protein